MDIDILNTIYQPWSHCYLRMKYFRHDMSSIVKLVLVDIRLPRPQLTCIWQISPVRSEHADYTCFFIQRHEPCPVDFLNVVWFSIDFCSSCPTTHPAYLFLPRHLRWGHTGCTTRQPDGSGCSISGFYGSRIECQLDQGVASHDHCRCPLIKGLLTIGFP